MHIDAGRDLSDIAHSHNYLPRVLGKAESGSWQTGFGMDSSSWEVVRKVIAYASFVFEPPNIPVKMSPILKYILVEMWKRATMRRDGEKGYFDIFIHGCVYELIRLHLNL